MKQKNKKGFTLIEMLVVVLIIGILAAIALPQYQKAIVKSKTAQMYEGVAAMAKAAQTFYMVQNYWPTSFQELDIDYDLPITDTSACLTSIQGEVMQKDDLEFVIHKGFSTNPYNHISVRFRDGPYKCTGFAFFLYYEANPSLENKLLCYERTDTYFRGSKNQKGDFCEKVMGYQELHTTLGNSSYFF